MRPGFSLQRPAAVTRPRGSMAPVALPFGDTGRRDHATRVRSDAGRHLSGCVGIGAAGAGIHLPHGRWAILPFGRPRLATSTTEGPAQSGRCLPRWVRQCRLPRR